MGKDMDSAEATDRRLASRELGRARRSVGALRNFYIANSILWGVALLLTLLAEGQGLVKAALGAGFLVMVAGVLQIRKQPFPWAIGIASLWTLFTIAWIASGRRLGSIHFFLMAAWTLGCWMMLPTTVKARKLLAEHPDLWIAKRMQGGRGGGKS